MHYFCNKKKKGTMEENDTQRLSQEDKYNKTPI